MGDVTEHQMCNKRSCPIGGCVWGAHGARTLASVPVATAVAREVLEETMAFILTTSGKYTEFKEKNDQFYAQKDNCF